MQMISGSIGKEKIHFQAPPSRRIPDEMSRFIQWFNDTATGGIRAISSAPVRASIAHLYFETIHPFEDGNGRIGRAIAEKTLSQTLGRPVMMSLSRTVEADRKQYHTALEHAQKKQRDHKMGNLFCRSCLTGAKRELPTDRFYTSKNTLF